MRKTKVTIDADKLQYSVRVLAAIAHPIRFRILEFIDQEGEINVNRIYRSLNLEQSITSQHLRIMRDAGIVKARRSGKFINYSIIYPVIERTEKAVNNFMVTEQLRELA